MASLIASGTDYADAFQMALAAASANCLNPVAGDFIPEKADEIFNLIKADTQEINL